SYQSSARVYVDTQSILKPLLSGMTTLPNVDQQVSIMSRTLISRPNVERVIRMVDLDLKTTSTKEHEKMVDELMSQIRIFGTSNDDIYSISYTYKDPQTVKNVVQSLLTIFVEGSYGDKKQDSVKAVRFIDEQIKEYEQRLVVAENALKDFKLRNSELLAAQGGDFGSKLGETIGFLNQARLELTEAEQARNSIKKEIAGEEPSFGTEQGTAGTGAVANPEIDARIESLNKSMDALRLQFTEQHPDIVAAKRLIAQLEARKVEEAKVRKPTGEIGRNYTPMLQQLKVALSDAEARVASMRARVEEYSARIARIKSASRIGPEIESQFSQLNRDYQVNKANYEKLVASREAAKLSGNLSSTTEMMSFRIVDPPVVPSTPIGPNRPLLVSIAFAAALVAGLATALLMSQIRPTFMSQASLREVTGLPVLGSVSMNWSAKQLAGKRTSMVAFSLAFGFLVLAYGGAMAKLLLKL
ncbi:MAG: chain length-determining protein, partial [Herminiimonas sp.]|nr:chain length-determining protein [Herminiimonas sp.]